MDLWGKKVVKVVFSIFLNFVDLTVFSENKKTKQKWISSCLKLYFRSAVSRLVTIPNIALVTARLFALCSVCSKVAEPSRQTIFIHQTCRRGFLCWLHWKILSLRRATRSGRREDGVGVGCGRGNYSGVRCQTVWSGSAVTPHLPAALNCSAVTPHPWLPAQWERRRSPPHHPHTTIWSHRSVSSCPQNTSCLHQFWLCLVKLVLYEELLSYKK